MPGSESETLRAGGRALTGRAAGAGAAQGTGSQVRGEVLGSWGGRAGADLTVALGEAAMLGPSGGHEGESTPHLPPTPTVLAREGIVSSR